MTDKTMMYVVTAEVGEWSDRKTWVVAALHDEAEAQRFAESAGAWFRDAKLRWEPFAESNDGYGVEAEERDRILSGDEWRSPFDPHFAEPDASGYHEYADALASSFDDVLYAVEAVPLFVATPRLG